MVFLLHIFNLHYRVFSLRLPHYFLCLLGVFGCQATVAGPSWSCLQAMLILFNWHFSTVYVCSIVLVVCVCVCVPWLGRVASCVHPHPSQGTFLAFVCLSIGVCACNSIGNVQSDADCSSSLSANWIASCKKLLWNLGGEDWQKRATLQENETKNV